MNCFPIWLAKIELLVKIQGWPYISEHV
uniref:Uncharacterized protein n=1 Tax=Tetranychus urticae TaxID=32264 RepID=T1KCI6_TETUR